MSGARWRILAGGVFVGLIGIVMSFQKQPPPPAPTPVPMPVAMLKHADPEPTKPTPQPRIDTLIPPPIAPIIDPPSPIVAVQAAEPIWIAPATPPQSTDPVIVPPPPETTEPPVIAAAVNLPPATPVVSAMPDAAAPAIVPFPWKVCLEVVNGQTQLELRSGDDSLLRVQCQSLDLATPGGGLIARGKVVVTGSCLEARCDKATIAWQTGQVALDGGVQLIVQNKGLMQTMRAESVTFRLAGANMPVEFTSRDVNQIVTPPSR